MSDIKRPDEAQFRQTLATLLNSRERLTREQMAQMFPDDGGLGSEMRAKLADPGQAVEDILPALGPAPPEPSDDKPRKRFNLFRRR